MHVCARQFALTEMVSMCINSQNKFIVKLVEGLCLHCLTFQIDPSFINFTNLLHGIKKVLECFHGN
jgi:hypothetical protein